MPLDLATFNLMVFAVPIVPGPYAQQRGGELERLVRPADVPPKDRARVRDVPRGRLGIWPLRERSGSVWRP